MRSKKSSKNRTNKFHLVFDEEKRRYLIKILYIIELS